MATKKNQAGDEKRRSVEAEIVDQLDEGKRQAAETKETAKGKKGGARPGAGRPPKLKATFDLSGLSNQISDLPLMLDAAISARFFGRVPVWPEQLHKEARAAFGKYAETLQVEVHPLAAWAGISLACILFAKRPTVEEALAMGGLSIPPPPANGVSPKTPQVPHAESRPDAGSAAVAAAGLGGSGQPAA